MEYSEEPPLIFSPLTNRDYCLFYSLEMDLYTEDMPFYKSFITHTDSILELGCGSGRLTRLLAPSCLNITGVDISRDMIDLAELQRHGNISYLCMDMINFNITHRFDIILIPYNTLNLLGQKSKIENCLRLCRKHLKPKAKLLLHLYHPDKKSIASPGKRIFQFLIMERREGGKLIKETLRSHYPETETTMFEERYRERPMQPGKQNSDLSHSLLLYTPPLHRWQELLEASGFSISGCWGNFIFAPFSATTDTSLLIFATPV